MKKILLIAFCLPMLFFSCKKKYIVPANTITAKVDGSPKIYFTSTDLSGSYTNASDLAISGQEGSNGLGEGILIEISAFGPIAKGTYKNDGSNNHYISISFFPPQTSSGVDRVIYTTDEKGIYPSMITILSISDEYVEGTFSGQLFTRDGKTFMVTDGKFVNLRKRDSTD